jgi:hypothetical protein
LGVRTFVEDDLAQVANLWWKSLRRGHGPVPAPVLSYFHELYFSNQPWINSGLPSLVYEGKNGRIVGFLGVIERKMLVCGEPIRVAYGGNFVVDPEARSPLAGLHLLRDYMAGNQDLSMTDSATDVSRHLLERVGFRTIIPLSISWARPLRPAHYAVHVMSSFTGSLLSAGLKVAAKPFCSVADSVAARVSFSPFRRSESRLLGTDLDVDMLLRCLTEFGAGYSLCPQYDIPSLSCLLAFMEKMHPRTELRKIVLRDDSQRIVGWYIYYLTKGAVGQVVQIGGQRQRTMEILDHMFHDAWLKGAVGIHGVVQSHMMGDFWEKSCFFTCRGGWTVAHSRRLKLLDVLTLENIFLSRLDGEWCMNFEE